VAGQPRPIRVRVDIKAHMAEDTVRPACSGAQHSVEAQHGAAGQRHTRRRWHARVWLHLSKLLGGVWADGMGGGPDRPSDLR
jgi:hypothetical protein